MVVFLTLSIFNRWITASNSAVEIDETVLLESFDLEHLFVLVTAAKDE